MADATAKFELFLGADVSSAAAAAGDLNAMKIAMQSDVQECNALKRAMADMSAAGKGAGEVFDAMGAHLSAMKERIAANQAAFVKLQNAQRVSGGEASPKTDQQEAQNIIQEAQAIEARIAARKRENQIVLAAKEAMAKQSRESLIAKNMSNHIAKAKEEERRIIERESNAMKNASKEANAAAGSLEELTYLAKGALGPMGRLFERGTMLLKGIGGGIVAMGVTAIAVVVAVAAAIAAAVVQMAQFAFATAEAERAQARLMLKVTGNAAAASGLQASIRGVAASLPVTEAEATKLAQKLYESGLRGQDLEDALRKAALQAAGLRENATDAEIADAMLDWKVQSSKLQESIAKIFGGPRVTAAVTKFLRALKDVTDLFGENTSAGQALHAIAESMLVPLFEQIAALGPFAKRFFQGMVVGALFVAIVALKVRNALRELIPGDAMAKVDWLQVALYAGVAAMVALAVVGAVVAAVLWMTVVAVVALVAALAVLAAIVFLPLIVFGLFIYAIQQVVSYLKTMGPAALDAASSIINGLLFGIGSGEGAVVNAMRNLAKGAMNAFKQMIGYGSPAKAFIEYGFTGVAGGVETGVDKGAPAVNSAVQDMVQIPAAPTTGPVKMGGAGAATITIPLTFQTTPPEAQRTFRRFAHELCETIEDACHSAGIPLELAVT